MIIEDADRFGLAQSHQLRGRVGRSNRESWCVLLAEPTSPDGQTRLEALVAGHDGFALAEIDADLRGEGTLLGTRQRGRSDLRLASLRRDGELLELARDVAQRLVQRDPELLEHRELADELRLFVDDDEADFLVKS
jgi:ATP-dependent DNA helicase RecG